MFLWVNQHWGALHYEPIRHSLFLIPYVIGRKSHRHDCAKLYASRVFNIKLSLPQLAAVIAKFDKNQNGTVDCTDFLLKVFTVGSQVRGLMETQRTYSSSKCFLVSS